VARGSTVSMQRADGLDKISVMVASARSWAMPADC